MTNKYLLKPNSFLTNNIISTVGIKANMLNGVLKGNIIDEINTEPVEVVIVSCVQDSLDFRCPENSQYVPIL